MKKTKAKQASPKKQAANSTQSNNNAPAQVYLLKEDILQQLPPEFRSMLLSERKFKSLKELEQLVISNNNLLFGEHTFLIRNKQGSTSQDLSPTFFLIDIGDIQRPKVYILEVVPAAGNFFEVLFPLITRFFSYFDQEEHINKVFDFIRNDDSLSKLIEERIDKEAIPSVLERLFWSKPEILLISDEDIRELPEIKATYMTTWHRVKPMVLRRYICNGNIICSIAPPFNELGESAVKPKQERKEKVITTEENHLEGITDDVREVYTTLKAELLKANSQLQFNPQKYYISVRNGRNIAFFHIHKKSIALVVMNPEADTRKKIKHHEVKALTEKVQKFWNGECCTIVIENAKQLNEVSNLLKKLVSA